MQGENLGISTVQAVFFYIPEQEESLFQNINFRNRKNLAFYFVDFIAGFHAEFCPESIIVPVPFRPASKRKRGWDPPGLLCRIIKKEYGAPVSACLIRENGPAQKTMDFHNRKSNIENRIRVKPGFPVTCEGPACR